MNEPFLAWEVHQGLCPECAFDWDQSEFEDLVGQCVWGVAVFGECISRLGDPSVAVEPGLWSASRYVWHTVDVLRFGTERLWTLSVDPSFGVPSWDENLMAERRSYDQLSPFVGLLAMISAVETWRTAALEAPRDVATPHPEAGTIDAFDLVQRNAHEVWHHLWDVQRGLPSGLDRPSYPTDAAIMVGIEPNEPEQQRRRVDRPDESADEIPSRRFDAWRRRSAVGGMATGIALGLQEVFYPNKNEPVISAEAPGEPPDADDRLRVILDPTIPPSRPWSCRSRTRPHHPTPTDAAQPARTSERLTEPTRETYASRISDTLSDLQEELSERGRYRCRRHPRRSVRLPLVRARACRTSGWPTCAGTIPCTGRTSPAARGTGPSPSTHDCVTVNRDFERFSSAAKGTMPFELGARTRWPSRA